MTGLIGFTLALVARAATDRRIAILPPKTNETLPLFAGFVPRQIRPRLLRQQIVPLGAICLLTRGRRVVRPPSQARPDWQTSGQAAPPLALRLAASGNRTDRQSTGQSIRRSSARHLRGWGTAIRGDKLLFLRDCCGKPDSTFPHHALAPRLPSQGLADRARLATSRPRVKPGATGSSHQAKRPCRTVSDSGSRLFGVSRARSISGRLAGSPRWPMATAACSA